MRLARWLDQLKQRPPNFRRPGTLIRRARQWPIAEVELLENRTQLTPMTSAASSDSHDVILEPTETPEIYLLTVTRMGSLTILLSAADGSRFVGNVTLLTTDQRLLRESRIDGETENSIATFTNVVGVGAYLLRIESSQQFSEPLAVLTLVTNPLIPRSAGEKPQAPLLVDLNEDMRLDIVAPGENGVSILINRGNGTFEPERLVDFSDRGSPELVIAADVDHMGGLDLVTLSPQPSNNTAISILLGNGGGTFADLLTVPIDESEIYAVRAMLLVDVDNDGYVDLVTIGERSKDIAVRLNLGGGQFEAVPRNFSVVDVPRIVRAVDINGDEFVDLLVSVSTSLVVLLGGEDENGQVRFVASSPQNVAAGDFAFVDVDSNHDHRIDQLVVTVGDGVSVFEIDSVGTISVTQQIGFDQERRTSALSVEDVNGDGLGDIISAGSFSEDGSGLAYDVVVLLGHADGTFDEDHGAAGNQHFAVGKSPEGDDRNVSKRVLAKDFNNDGHVDLVTANHDSSDLSVLLGHGDGTFSTEQRLVVGEEPPEVLAADLNGDQRLDLITSSARTSDVWILFGRGDGTFAATRYIAVGSEPAGVLAVDLNGDDRIDLVTPNLGSNDVSVLLGRGDGTFESERHYGVGTYPISVRALDRNGDGRIDLVTDNDGSDQSLLLGRGDGTFESERREVFDEERSLGEGSTSSSNQSADLNGDGQFDVIDLFQASSSRIEVRVQINDGQGGLANALSVAPIAVGARPVVEDINGYGIDDVLVLRQDGAVLYRQGTRASMSGTGESGTTSVIEFGTAVELNPGHPARDFTLLRSPSGLRIATLDVSGSAVSLYQFDASATLAQGSFRLTDSVPISGSIPGRIASGNFDQDSAGRDDFALINQGTQTVTLYLADATGFHSTETFDAGAGPVSFTTTDLNRDGLTDFLVPNFGSGDVSVFTNVGEGDFATSLVRTGRGPYFIGPTPYDASRIESQSFEQTSSAEVGDFNGDGLPDVIATNPGSNSWSILFGTTHGLSSDPAVTLLGNSPSRFAAVRVADVNHDGHDDAVFLNESGTQLSVYLNSADTSGRRSLQLTRTIDLPTPLTGFILHDANGDDRPDVFATNEFGDLLLLLNQGDGRFEEDRQSDRSIPIAVQDLDGDGKLDVVLANQGLDAVKINYGRSNNPAALLELASSDDGVAAPGAVKLADLNGDGVVDLIVPNTGGNSVLIYKGHVGANGRGDGTFEAGESIFTGSNPASVTVNDLDHDGRMDLVVTNRGSNTIAVFYGQAASDSQTIAGTTAIPFRAGALSKLPSGSGPVDAQVVSLPNPDGSMQTGLVVTNSTSNSVSFIPSAGNGIFNAIPSNTVPLGFSPLPGAIVNGNLVLPNPDGNSLAFVPLSATNFSGSQPAISFSLPVFDHPVGIDGSADVNHDGLFDLLVANNGDGSISLLLGDGKSFDFNGSFFLDGITHASALQVAGFELYVTEEGHEFFTVFDLADLRFEKGDQILDFEEIVGSVASTVGSTTSRPIYGLGPFSPLFFAFFGQFPLEEDADRTEVNASDEPASWQTLALIVTQMTQQFDHLSKTFGNGLLVSMLETLSTDLGLPKLTNQQLSQTTFETLVAPLSLLSGIQPLTQLARTLRSLQSLWPTRPNVPTNRPAGSSTPPAAKTPLKAPMKTAPAQSTAIPTDAKTSEAATASPADSSSSTSDVQTTHTVRQTGLAKYMTQLATNPAVASDLFDRQWRPLAESSLPAIETSCSTESDAGWQVFASSAVVAPALAELSSRRLRNRWLQNMI